ncbi:MAG: hypothetical protein AUJ92_04420 [Armatimonadetes bacterium CG2_30_59_28]|nr:hypothetical protein [Armatimonadota bacterium]OIO97041.1 MAG: hypothetical protein AUJ92_04420 [Armatimonadetes bacterium CG2_30_59_28]PIU67600.1 MAG: hypothetical protein COS85_00075 [Armatimonadetes bacterium CG07_land_8_20_14_0_80_59_28]PIX42042.1 MAG: hypothetical protein COZ56_10285 [Armatimonadetes bacterium CG_4_8_14_3_um_filter_58_9]PIY42769.1 MAG: hypothetical protein COZ05_13020 [Armatimonadetes bacterium CG_4_10_14_3_um_filter_59_10]PJB66730.1 MAG: hypothetical protein CO095_127
MPDACPEKGFDAAALKSLPKHAGRKVVYADGCTLSPTRLQKEKITFKQIPYQVKVRQQSPAP